MIYVNDTEYFIIFIVNTFQTEFFFFRIYMEGYFSLSLDGS